MKTGLRGVEVVLGFIRNVIVEDETSHTASLVKAANHELAGKPFEEDRADSFVTRLRGNGGATAFYETFHDEASGSSPAPVHLQDDGIAIHLRPNWDGPPYLLLGADVGSDDLECNELDL